MKFDKLVRDKIPQILEEKGLVVLTYICHKDEYYDRLKDKLKEEVDEFLNDDTIEELADILEVVYAIAACKGLSKEKLEELRQKKAQERGAFEKRIVLSETTKR